MAFYSSCADIRGGTWEARRWKHEPPYRLSPSPEKDPAPKETRAIPETEFEIMTGRKFSSIPESIEGFK